MTLPEPSKSWSAKHQHSASVDILVSRSSFFKAARKPEWTESTKPACLEDEDSVVFSRYLNCVYFGTHALNLGGVAPEDDRESLDPQEESQPRPDVFNCSEEGLEARSEQAAPFTEYYMYV
jgi:hypothetical protein